MKACYKCTDIWQDYYTATDFGTVDDYTMLSSSTPIATTTPLLTATNTVGTGTQIIKLRTMVDQWAGHHLWWDDDIVPRQRQVRLELKDDLVIIPGLQARNFKLPDGGILRLDAMGNYKLDDSQAQVIYQASRNKAFNPYVNASDMLAKFIEFLGPLHVRRHEVSELPLKLFVNWLILAAASADGDTPPAGVIPITRKHLPNRVGPRCPACGHFVVKSLGYQYCNPTCAAQHYERLTAKASHETNLIVPRRIPRRRIYSGSEPMRDVRLLGPGRTPSVRAEAVA